MFLLYPVRQQDQKLDNKFTNPNAGLSSPAAIPTHGENYSLPEPCAELRYRQSKKKIYIYIYPHFNRYHQAVRCFPGKSWSLSAEVPLASGVNPGGLQGAWIAAWPSSSWGQCLRGIISLCHRTHSTNRKPEFHGWGLTPQPGLDHNALPGTSLQSLN